GTQHVANLISCDCAQPPLKRVARPVTAKIGNGKGHRAKHLLHHVRCVGRLQVTPPTPLVHHRTVERDEPPPRLAIARPHPHQQAGRQRTRSQIARFFSVSSHNGQTFDSVPPFPHERRRETGTT